MDRAAVPRHLAVIMDGNGRWALARGQPRPFGHRAGAEATRRLVQAAGEAGVEVLTVYAFSQENWTRPATEVGLLMRLFKRALGDETRRLHDNDIRLRFIGDRSAFAPRLQAAMAEAEALTAGNRGMQLLVAVGYGGQWDILQAAEACRRDGVALSVATLESRLMTAGLPPVDLLIRTGGESRISNFLLWQSAYAELYFCPVLWPDFEAAHLHEAFRWYAGRERRYGGVPGAVTA